MIGAVVGRGGEERTASKEAILGEHGDGVDDEDNN
jgi:hypothetical protein